MPAAASATQALVEQVSLARAAALAGDYVTAATYYRGVAAQITRCVCGDTPSAFCHPLAAVSVCDFERLLLACSHVHGLGEPQLQKQWLRLSGLVQEEHDVTAALQAASASGTVARPQVSVPLCLQCVRPPLTHT